MGELPNLRALSLRASRVTSLECLVGHPALERISISFWGLRDLRPLATIPTLRDVSLHRIRLLATNDLKPLAHCAVLDALEMQNLPNVTSLEILGHCQARFLSLEGLTLDSLVPLANWARLRNLMLVNTVIRDQQISPLLQCGDLRHVSVGHARRNVFRDEEVRAFVEVFGGDSFWYLNRYFKGTRPPGIFWELVARTREEDPPVDAKR